MAKNSNWSVLVDVEINAADLQKKINEAAKSMKLKADTGEADKALDKTTEKAEKLGLTYQEANLIMQKSLDIMRQMADVVSELDAALIEYQKVSDLSGKSLKRYSDNLGEMGLTVARTTTEMVNAAAMFRKSGFNDKDAATLATISSLFQNVADEQLSAADAASSVISQMRAFNIDADNAVHIIDVYNAVANNFAVGTGDLKQ